MGEWTRDTILTLCQRLKRHAVPLVEIFYPGEAMMDSMIAPADGDLYGSIINRIFYSGDSFGRARNWKENVLEEKK